MQIVRIIVWVVFGALGLILFMLNFGEPQPLRILPGVNGDNRLVEWPIAIIGLFFFLLGFLPMWVLHHIQKWRWRRRINLLETATTKMTPPTPAPAAAPAAPTSPPRQDLPPEPANPVEPEPSKPS